MKINWSGMLKTSSGNFTFTTFARHGRPAQSGERRYWELSEFEDTFFGKRIQHNIFLFSWFINQSDPISPFAGLRHDAAN